MALNLFAPPTFLPLSKIPSFSSPACLAPLRCALAFFSFLSFNLPLSPSILSLSTATSSMLPLMTSLSDSENSLWQTKQAEDLTSLRAFTLKTCPQPRSTKNPYFPLNSRPVIGHSNLVSELAAPGFRDKWIGIMSFNPLI
ncbi:unnamed protein product [Musa acuminata subsp. malaccensis]|uniref:(wild Malaysian banana) hypothetical protein n=1 Tax=Musa acuminata subsp. malaccensis TaxID=214687 RepID=A0A8D7AV75_MUSAM|nr:unnamed protein product [Musa acuminata subsp. malaccensis]